MYQQVWYCCVPLLTINHFAEARAINSSFVPVAWFGLGASDLKEVYGNVSVIYPLSKTSLNVLQQIQFSESETITKQLVKSGSIQFSNTKFGNELLAVAKSSLPNIIQLCEQKSNFKVQRSTVVVYNNMVGIAISFGKYSGETSYLCYTPPSKWYGQLCGNQVSPVIHSA